LALGIRRRVCDTERMTRIERFRAYMARMSPVADPEAAIREKLYVRPPGRSVAEELATRLELEPASTHLVLGGIGSGKTSELLVARERLERSLGEVGDHFEYIDVSRRLDLGAPTLYGVLAALAGQSLARRIRVRPTSPRPLAGAVDAMRNTAPSFDPDPEPDERPRRHHGALVARETTVPYLPRVLAEQLRTLRAAYPGGGRHAIFLFDSLDRLPHPDNFRDVVQDDLRALKAAGIGVVVVGPLRFVAGTDRAIGDLFDQTHFVPAPDPVTQDGLAFLTSVLRARADPSALPDECLAPIARASGGVMRDLISLAKRVGHEAYAAGHGRISPDDVARAVDAFGRNLAVGLDDAQVKRLRHVQRGKGFVIRGEQELSLLETGRILLHGESRFAVHPALAPLLDTIPEAA
jgi:hypothetical protein